MKKHIFFIIILFIAGFTLLYAEGKKENGKDAPAGDTETVQAEQTTQENTAGDRKSEEGQSEEGSSGASSEKTSVNPNTQEVDVDNGPNEPQGLTKEQEMLWERGFQVPQKPLDASDFTLNNLDGKEIALSDFQGNIVFLNFWATWCPPCRQEMPSMQTLHEKLDGKAFVMLAVNLQESESTVKDFLKKNSYTFPVLLDSEGKVGGGMYGVSSIPTTYLIDKKGGILARLVGTKEWDTKEMIEMFDTLIN